MQRDSKSRRLIQIKKASQVIFVGDTHGDLQTTKKIIYNYLKPKNKIVFLGDYIDRGPYSRENLDFLLDVRKKHPNNIILLQGNHEGYRIKPFTPADFWQNLNRKDRQRYCSIVENLPLVVSVGDVIALHAALPDIKKITAINKIKTGSKEWTQICWGDFSDESKKYLNKRLLAGRPKFGRDYFFRLMKRLNKKVLVRSHDPNAPLFMFNNKCLTIISSSVYKDPNKRLIAILNPKTKIRTAKDLKIKII